MIRKEAALVVTDSAVSISSEDDAPARSPNLLLHHVLDKRSLATSRLAGPTQVVISLLRSRFRGILSESFRPET